jgi:hypothetical protein
VTRQERNLKRRKEAVIRPVNHPARRAEGQDWTAWAEDTLKTLVVAYHGKEMLGCEGKYLPPEALRRLWQQVDALRRELAGDRPNLLEQLLVYRIVCCWVEVTGADMRRSLCPADDPMASALERWQQRAQRRLLAACKTLAQVRKLLGLSIHVAVPGPFMATLEMPKRETTKGGEMVGYEACVCTVETAG